ncbi:hypothetical protein ES705_11644 [subsurface metagenome]
MNGDVWDSWMGKGGGGGFAEWTVGENVYWDPSLFESQIDPSYGFWGGLKDFGSGALSFGKDVLKFGSQAYGAYVGGQRGQGMQGAGSLVNSLPPKGSAPPMIYEMQRQAQPIPTGGQRISLGSLGGGSGINMNMILIGGAVVLAAFMMKGK